MTGGLPGSIHRLRPRGGRLVPQLRETLIPFADAVPHPTAVLDERGEILYVNAAMRAGGVELPADGSRALARVLPHYYDALGGDPRWLHQQEAKLVRTLPGGIIVHERLWLRRLPKGACLIIEDETHLRELEAGQAQTARLASLGFMLASVSHEISSPLAGVQSILQILQSKRGVNPQTLEKGLLGIATSVRRILAITRKLNVFARVGSEAPSVFPVDCAIEEATAQTGYDSLGETVEIVHERVPGALVFGHSSQLQQVFHNLLLNAVQAMRGRGSIFVATSLTAHHVIVTVRDTGPGLPAGVRERVFEPFFSTKASGEGTGLGLAISHEIVHEHHGQLVADNHPTGGALFTVTLPRHVPPPGRRR